MAWKTSVLVVANVTADSDELLTALLDRARDGATTYTLLVPARAAGERARDAAQRRLEAALAHARELGLEIDGQVGDCDPIVAVDDIFDPRRFDEIIVSTLPAGMSRWLMVDLPARLRRQTDVSVRHVVASERRPPIGGGHVPAAARRGVLAPLTPLTWGRRPPVRAPIPPTRARPAGDSAVGDASS